MNNSSFRSENWRWYVSVSCLAPEFTVLLRQVVLEHYWLVVPHLLELFGKELECFQFIQTEFSALLNSWNTHMHDLWPPLILFSFHRVSRGMSESEPYKNTPISDFQTFFSPPCSIHSSVLLSTICHDGASFIQSDKVNCSLEDAASLMCCIQAFLDTFTFAVVQVFCSSCTGSSFEKV